MFKNHLKYFQVVSALLEFLYTGEMTVDRSDTADLQRLIETLQIDPDLITVDVVDKTPKVEKSPTKKHVDKEKPPTDNDDDSKTDEKYCVEKNVASTHDEDKKSKDDADQGKDFETSPSIVKKRKFDDDDEQEPENVDSKKTKN